MIGPAIWAATIERELRAAGFPVQRLNGCPYVEHTPSFWEGSSRLLEVKLSVPAERFLYGLGTLYIPVGATDLRKGTPV